MLPDIYTLPVIISHINPHSMLTKDNFESAEKQYNRGELAETSEALHDQPFALRLHEISITESLRSSSKRRGDEDEVREDIETYIDMEMLNPDWNFAKKHAQATRPGIRKKDQESQVCICCYKQINKTPIPLCQNIKQLEFLGFGYPLYFIFLKFALFILLIEILNYTAIQLFRSFHSNYNFCVEDVYREMGQHFVSCTSFMVFVATIDEELEIEEQVLRVSSFCTLLVFVVYLRDHFMKTWRAYDQRDTDFEDYSIILSNLPTKEAINDHRTIGRVLRDFFGNRTLFYNQPKISKINLIGQFDNIHKLNKKQKKIIADIQFLLGRGNSESKENTQDNLKKNLKRQKYLELKQIYQSLQQQRFRVERLINREDLNCDKAILCFQTQQEMEQVLHTLGQLNPAIFEKHFFDQQIQFKRAAKPIEIDWQNINVSDAFKFRRRIISWFIFVLILAALTIGVYFVFNWKSNLVLTAEQGDARIIVFSSILFIILFNKFIMAEIIHALVEFELKKTGMNYAFSYMLKYSLGLFFTTALMSVLVEGLTHQNVYQEDFGIIEEETLFFLYSVLIVPLIWIINPWYIKKRIQRSKFQGSPYCTQQEANHFMEDPEYIMGKRYGEVLQAFWFVFLYSCLIPIGSICVFIQLSLYYWIDKYNLLRRSSIVHGVSGELALKALYLLEFVLVIKPGGELIFDGLMRRTWSIISVIQLSLGLIYLLLPMNKIMDYLHHQKFKASQLTYTQLKQQNIFSYQLYNPLTKQRELAKYFDRIENCSNREHHHHCHREEGQGLIIRPHMSEKKEICLFGQVQLQMERISSRIYRDNTARNGEHIGKNKNGKSEFMEINSSNKIDDLQTRNSMIKPKRNIF